MVGTAAEREVVVGDSAFSRWISLPVGIGALSSWGVKAELFFARKERQLRGVHHLELAGNLFRYPHNHCKPPGPGLFLPLLVETMITPLAALLP